MCVYVVSAMVHTLTQIHVRWNYIRDKEGKIVTQVHVQGTQEERPTTRLCPSESTAISRITYVSLLVNL